MGTKKKKQPSTREVPVAFRVSAEEAHRAC